jgi:cell division protein ZapA
MDSEKKSVRVTIYGQAYTLRVAEDPREVEELAGAVDRLMASLAVKSGTADPARVAVLACLHLADRMRALERDLAALKQRVEQKTEQFSLLLDQALEPRE